MRPEAPASFREVRKPTFNAGRLVAQLVGAAVDVRDPGLQRLALPLSRINRSHPSLHGNRPRSLINGSRLPNKNISISPLAQTIEPAHKPSNPLLING
jgi:hypothetical protein